MIFIEHLTGPETSVPHVLQVLKDLRAETAAMHGSHMQITPDQGALLALLVGATGARRIVEVGVFTGYSSIAMAMVSCSESEVLCGLRVSPHTSLAPCPPKNFSGSSPLYAGASIVS